MNEKKSNEVKSILSRPLQMMTSSIKSYFAMSISLLGTLIQIAGRPTVVSFLLIKFLTGRKHRHTHKHTHTWFFRQV